MENLIDADLFSQVEEHLKCTEQSWLMGAGISFDAKLPLMYPLTNKVKKDLKADSQDIFNKIVSPYSLSYHKIAISNTFLAI